MSESGRRADSQYFHCESCSNIIGIPISLPPRACVACEECGCLMEAEVWREFADLIPDGDKKDLAAVALGRMGGRRGGPARAKALTPERRTEIAQHAAQARWRKHAENSEKP